MASNITQQHFDEVKDNLEKQLAAQKEYFERVLVEKDKALEKALASAKEAVQVAETNAEKWRASANEWRGAMSDKDKNFVLSKEFDPYRSKIDSLETKQAIVDSKAESWLVWIGLFFTGASFFFSTAGLIISLYVVFVK